MTGLGIKKLKITVMFAVAFIEFACGICQLSHFLGEQKVISERENDNYVE